MSIFSVKRITCQQALINTIGNQIQTDTGVYSDGSTGIDQSGDAKKNKEGETESVSYDYDDGGKSQFY